MNPNEHLERIPDAAIASAARAGSERRHRKGAFGAATVREDKALQRDKSVECR